MADLFTLRPAREDDKGYLDVYAYAEGMDNMPSIENITCAVNAEDQVVGYVRIAMGANGVAHVNPVITGESWRGYGVGRALMEDALARYGELRLVSRGWSADFYRALGYKEIPWEAIDLAVVDDCEGCEMREECGPVPMGKVLE